MITLQHIKGAIFDLDDTLLDNGPADKPAEWLHSRSRLAAVHEVARAHNIAPLLSLTEAENGKAFMTAATHSVQGAVWNIFFMKGLVHSNVPDPDSEYSALAAEIATRKHELHEIILQEYGVELPGAAGFVRALAANGFAKHLALATSAITRDITIFLDKYDLHGFFPPQRIVSAEKVTRPKPDPECFDLAFRTLGLPDADRRSVLAFEDNPRGMQSAKAAGLYVCAITSRYKADDPALLAAGPDVVADSYAEFTSLLGI